MPASELSAWRRTLARHLLALVLAAVSGLALGHPWPALALAAIAMLGWHLWWLRRILARLAARRRPPPPRGNGAWDGLERLLRDAHDGLRGHRLRLLSLLRAYRAAADALPDAVVVLERNSQRVRWFNRAASHLLGLRAPQDTGAPLAQRLQPLQLAGWLSQGRHAEPIPDAPSPVSPDARLHLRLLPYSDELWLLVARDVSRVTRLEQMRRDFVANVSHELRTPLTVLHGYLDMLDPDRQPEWAPILREMQHQSQRMARLVEDLLTLSRLEAQDGIGEEEEVSMSSMLASLGREARALSQGRHTIDVVDEAGVDLLGSPRELHSAFSNLVSNAVRHTPSGGTIGIRFSRDGDGAVLAVRDTGCGIPAEHLPRLTERFYRVSTSRSRESGGTGLGLAIVKHVLQLHQARLGIESEVGRGSTFSCHFGAHRVIPRHGAGNGAQREQNPQQRHPPQEENRDHATGAGRGRPVAGPGALPQP